MGIEVVEAFATKCRDTPVDKGVIVSPSGFSEPARVKAERVGIRCLDLERVEGFDWFGVGQIQLQLVEIPRIDMTVIPECPITAKPVRFQVLDANGEPVSAGTLEANVRNALSGFQLAPGTVRQAFSFLTPGFQVQDPDSQERHPIARIEGTAEIVTKVSWVPFDKVVYQDKAGSGVISQAAIAELAIGDIRGNLVFSNEGSKGTQIAFVITKPPAPPGAGVASRTIFEAPKP